MLGAGVTPVRRDERKKATRDRLIEAALRLFAARGYDATLVEEITRSAGVAKGTFFNYFKTKEDLLVQVASYQLDWLAERLAVLTAEPGELTPRFIDLMVQVATRPGLTRPLIQTLSRVALTSPEPGQVTQAAAMAGSCVPLFAAGQDRGEFTRRIPADVLAQLATQTYLAALLMWSAELSDDPLDRWMKLSFRALFHGIRAETEMAPQ